MYTENTYYGDGKRLDEVTQEELKADLAERESENPLAYRGKMEYKFSKNEIKSMKKLKK